MSIFIYVFVCVFVYLLASNFRIRTRIVALLQNYYSDVVCGDSIKKDKVQLRSNLYGFYWNLIGFRITHCRNSAILSAEFLAIYKI